MTTTIAELTDDLVAHFLVEAGRGGHPDPRDYSPRRLLADLLTVRPPSSLPPLVRDALDELLQRESATRGTVESATLPTLADQRVSSLPYAARVALWLGDLTMLRADAIVNAANSAMLGCFVPGHACIDNAIHASAGPGLRLECAAYMRERNAPESTGSAIITAGYNLPARSVIHTVGPIVRTPDPTPVDRDLLRSSYISILELAHVNGLQTVGFCAISTGVFGYPKSEGAQVALTTIREWLDGHPESNVHPIIAAFTELDLQHYLAAVPR
jgi:O-acetyl-ADP-ribose deacetylase (regulator of RNase III)